MSWRCSLGTVLILAFASIPHASAQTKQTPEPRTRVTGGIDTYYSPAVFGAFEVRRKTLADTTTLDLLILWRGSPGWLDKAARNDGLFPPLADRRQGVRLHLGPHDYDFARDHEAGTVRFMGITYDVKGANVMLIDGVDAPAGRQVITMLTVDPRLPPGISMGPGVDSLIVQTPALMKFLDCNRPAATDLLRRVVAQGVCGLPKE